MNYNRSKIAEVIKTILVLIISIGLIAFIVYTWFNRNNPNFFANIVNKGTTYNQIEKQIDNTVSNLIKNNIIIPNQQYINNQMINDSNVQTSSSFGDEKMSKANEIAGKIVKSRLQSERPEDLEVLENVEKEDVVIVRGTYDRVEDILHFGEIPFGLINPGDVGRINLNPKQILIINCPGNLDTDGIKEVKAFVERGGYLFTTDWALLNVLEKAFPGYLEYNNIPTDDDVVEVEIVDTNNPFLHMIMSENADPNWWLEGSSYPIKILDKEKVKVLLQSKEMEEKYGESAIAIYFEYGKGKIFHITSHFYLQRAETRTERQMDSSKSYVNELAVPEEYYEEYKEDLDDINVSEIQSTYAMQQFMTNIIIDRKKTQEINNND